MPESANRPVTLWGVETVERESVRVAFLDDGFCVLVLRAALPDEEWRELPGGGIEPCETPEQAARRELVEETGIVVQRFERDLGSVETEFLFDGRRHFATRARVPWRLGRG